jgi:hypothetical protein
MYYKDYSQPYARPGETCIEIQLQDNTSKECLKKILIWSGDFDSIVSKIPLNEEGEYVALAYHYNVDWPWEELAPSPWKMDQLKMSLTQLKEIEIHDEREIIVWNDICSILEEAIKDKNTVLITYV